MCFTWFNFFMKIKFIYNLRTTCGQIILIIKKLAYNNMHTPKKPLSFCDKLHIAK